MPARLTRRQLLARGAGAAGAGLLAGALPARAQDPAAPAPAPAPPPRPTVVAPGERMLKGVSLIGIANPYDDGYGVRPYLLGGPHPTDVVTFWVNWSELQPAAPRPFTLAQSFRDLGDPAGPGSVTLTKLDEQIARANADGRLVSLCVYQSVPAWARTAESPLTSGTGAGAAGLEPPEDDLPEDARVPDDRTEDGPWAWFVAWLCARYADTGGLATPGPGLDGAAVGNPSAARVAWLQPINEPNLVWWPQASPLYPDETLASAVAELMRTAAAVAARYRNGAALPQGPELLMPNTSDVPDEGDARGTPWRVFTAELLERLRGWQPETPVGWSHHNYVDVKRGPQTEGPGAGRWRAEETIDLLRAGGWPDPSLWLTEGGYQFATVRASADPNHWVVAPEKTADPAQPDAYAEQAATIAANWAAMAQLPVRMWTQYLVNDFDVRWQSGLRGPLRTAADGTAVQHDPPYPAYGLWPTLVG